MDYVLGLLFSNPFGSLMVAFLSVFWNSALRKAFNEVLIVTSIDGPTSSPGDEEAVLAIHGRRAGLISFLLHLFKLGTRVSFEVRRHEVRLEARASGLVASPVRGHYIHSIPLQQKPSVITSFLALPLFIVLLSMVFLLSSLISSLVRFNLMGLVVTVLMTGVFILWYILARSISIQITGHSRMGVCLKQGLLTTTYITPDKILEAANFARDCILQAALPITSVSDREAPNSIDATGGEHQVARLTSFLEEAAKLGFKRSTFLQLAGVIEQAYAATSGVARLRAVRTAYQDHLNELERDRGREAAQLWESFEQIARDVAQRGHPPISATVRQAVWRLRECSAVSPNRSDEASDEMGWRPQPEGPDGSGPLAGKPERLVEQYLLRIEQLANQGLSVKAVRECLALAGNVFPTKTIRQRIKVMWNQLNRLPQPNAAAPDVLANQLYTVCYEQLYLPSSGDAPGRVDELIRGVLVVLRTYYPNTPAAENARTWLSSL
jgi:hypothetical protein